MAIPSASDAETHLATFFHKGEKENDTIMRGLDPRISSSSP
jgi:hypothetical protein